MHVTSDHQGDDYTGTTAALTPRMHILYAFATDGQEASSVNTATAVTGQSSPFIGRMAAYVFHVMASSSPSTNANLSNLVLS